MEDIRYSEFLFLQAIATGQVKHVCCAFPTQSNALGLASTRLHSEMVIAALAGFHIRFGNDGIQMLGARLRGEITFANSPWSSIPDGQWHNPRQALENILRTNDSFEVGITYSGLQRLEELRELLRRDRILEFFGVLLDLRYFRRDLMLAFQRSPDTAVTVLYADMDNFGKINKKFGQAAGDVVMKAYLEVVRDVLGDLGNGYRSLGDETVSLIVGQTHQRALELAEAIRSRVKTMRCEYNGKKLPGVSVSIGVATTPPEVRTADIIDIAEERKRKAKKAGRDCVISK
jgi:diguanylate cyclase (GGDEF)-like protein